MSDRPVEIVRLSEIERRREWIPIRAHFGVRAFGVNAWTAEEAGDKLISEHDEKPTGHEELYVVVSGHATFTVAGDEIDGPAGTIVFVRDPATRRGAVARAPGTTVLTVGAAPGKAYEVMGWEAWRDAEPHYEAKDYAKATEVLREAHERHPEDPGVLFNLACCESLDGRRGEALAHLERCVELSPSFAELARADADFDPTRDDPRFESAVAGKTEAGGAGA